MAYSHRVVICGWAEDMPLPSGFEAERFGPRTPIGADICGTMRRRRASGSRLSKAL